MEMGNKIRTFAVVLSFFISAVSELTYYTYEETQEIRNKEQSAWDSVVFRMATTRAYSCVVPTSLAFAVEPP